MVRARVLTLILLLGFLAQSVLPAARLPRAYAMPAEPMSGPPVAPNPTPGPLPPARTSHVPLQQAPLAFEPNMGQSDPEVRYLLRAPGSTIFFTPVEAVFARVGAGRVHPGASAAGKRKTATRRQQRRHRE